jgi:hypothetical protein
MKGSFWDKIDSMSKMSSDLSFRSFNKILIILEKKNTKKMFIFDYLKLIKERLPPK